MPIGVVDATAWKTIKAENVAKSFEWVKPSNRRSALTAKDFSTSGCSEKYLSGGSPCFTFRTYDNTLGVYQINGLDNDGVRGVWIRYKLVADAAAPAAPENNNAENAESKEVEAVAKEFMAALRDKDLEAMKRLSLGAVEGWSDDAENRNPSGKVGLSVEGLEAMTKELRDGLFARSPQLLTDIQETAALGDYAAARIPGPDGKDEGHYLRPIFKRTPQGWRFLSMDDSRGELKEALAQYVRSLTTASKNEQSSVPLQQSVFGPVVTRTLFSATEYSIKGEDLDKGEVIKLPEQVKKDSDNNEGHAFRWFTELGVDLLVANQGMQSPGFVATLELATVKNELWEQAGAAEVQASLDSGEVGPQLKAMGEGEGFIFYEIKPDAAFPMTFAFKTPAGGKGLLQFLGFTENKLGTRIRYKLLQGTANSLPKPQNTDNLQAKTEDSKERFSPVIERVVNDRRHNLTDCAIDFETGKLLSLPECLGAESNRAEEIRIEEALAWVRDHGVDAIGSLTSGEGIMSCCELESEGMTQLFAEKVENDLWDKMSEKDLSKAILISEWRNGKEKSSSLVRMLTEAPDYSSMQPATYIFETREGGKGILQILGPAGPAGAPTGVKFRYKLMQKPANLTLLPEKRTRSNLSNHIIIL